MNLNLTLQRDMRGLCAELADDLRQDALVYLITNARKHRGHTAAWKRTRCYWNAQSDLRGQRRQQTRTYSLEQLLEEQGDFAMDWRSTEDLVIERETQREQRQRLAMAHARLPLLTPAQRMVMTFLFDGAKPAQIAQRLGTSAAYISTTIKRARQRLQATL